MTVGRRYHRSATPQARRHLEDLFGLVGRVEAYRQGIRALGRDMGELLVKKLRAHAPVVLVCTAEDADFLAAGILEVLEQERPDLDVALVCFWNDRRYIGDLKIAQIVRTYVEPLPEAPAEVIIVKSLISGTCVVRTNLLEILERLPAEPRSIFVVAPVMHEDAPDKLRRSFPAKLSERFEYLCLALDSQRDEATSHVSPGLGEGDFYQNLGWRDQDEKNQHRPEIVRERNLRYLESLSQTAHPA